MKATLRDDLILAIGRGDTEIGRLPAGVGTERLRWDGSQLVDLAEAATIHVRHLSGSHFELHAIPVAGSQPVAMSWSDRRRLIAESGVIRLSTPAEKFTDLSTSTLANIDRDTDAIYGVVLGNRGPEYLDAEVAAQAYKDAGYLGTVPGDVHCYAAAKGWTAQQAADDILATATAWRSAKASIRAQRLMAKEAVRAATAAGGVETALLAWRGFVAGIRAQLKI